MTRFGDLFMARRLSVIVPTYNEAENIAELLERVATSLKGVDFEVIVVDDGSPDGTADVAEKFGEIHGNVRVLRRPDKMGLASAVIDGARLAESDIVAVIDADLQHPPEIMPKMLQKIEEGNDLVVASRFVEGGGVEGWGLGRSLVSKGATALAHFLLSETRRVKDPMSGYFMSRKNLLMGIELDPTGYKILVEILVRNKNNSVTEVPYVFKPRLRGESKLSFKEVVRYLQLLYKLTM